MGIKKDRPISQKSHNNSRKEDSVVPMQECNMEEENSGHLAAIVATSEDAIISKSLDGTIKSWNKGSEKMFGFTSQEAIGKHISLIIPPQYSDEEKNIVERICNNEVIEHYETIRNKKDGEQFHVSLTVSPLKDSTGKIIGSSKIARDITVRKRAQAENVRMIEELIYQNGEKEKRAAELVIANAALAFQNEEKEKRAEELRIANIELIYQNGEKEKRAAELIIANKELAFQNEEKIGHALQLESVNRELESFSYSVSHDLRSPLRAIQGYTEMLKAKQADGNTNPEADRLMNNIISNAKKMGQLIDDLLGFSRIGRKELVMTEVQMNDLVTSLCNELKKEHQNLNLEFQIAPLLPASADYITMKQVWVNLISNAIKYSRFKNHAIIEINSERMEDETIYSIKDNGSGFDMRYAHKLFGVFQRLHSDEEFEGTGVGLAIVQRIINKHGGRVWAEGKVNEGATFFFTLKTG
ncbi:MAG: PAS domain S-box protein [Bacteroidia bacterium]